MLLLHPGMLDASSEAESSEFEEDDDEVAHTSSPNHIVICYDVMFSPSYRVPVVYFAVSDIQHRYPPTVETLYSHIIPPTFRAQTGHVGVIGGITVTVRLHRYQDRTELTLRQDHPSTNKPVFFIHPCRTAEVMEAAVTGRNTTAYDYLVIWIGALGKYVGLNVPLALVTQTLEVD